MPGGPQILGERLWDIGDDLAGIEQIGRIEDSLHLAEDVVQRPNCRLTNQVRDRPQPYSPLIVPPTASASSYKSLARACIFC